MIKSSAVNFSHKNHLYYFDHIPSCQFFTWELLVMPNPPTVNFTHENHSSCFDQIPNYQFFTWESLIMLRSNPQLSIFHMRITWYDLIKSSTVKYSHENHLFCFDQISSCQFFTWESLVMLWSNPHLSIYITLIKSPTVNFSHENHLYYFDQIPTLSIFHIRITYHALIKSTAVHSSHENHLLWFDQILSCQIFTWESLIML